MTRASKIVTLVLIGSATSLLVYSCIADNGHGGHTGFFHFGSHSSHGESSAHGSSHGGFGHSAGAHGSGGHS